MAFSLMGELQTSSDFSDGIRRRQPGALERLAACLLHKRGD